jgi:ethanolamine ammonia-lyase large subunit
VSLAQFLSETAAPYEHDEVTRLILDMHDPAAFVPAGSLTVGGLSLARAANGRSRAKR